MIKLSRVQGWGLRAPLSISLSAIVNTEQRTERFTEMNRRASLSLLNAFLRIRYSSPQLFPKMPTSPLPAITPTRSFTRFAAGHHPRSYCVDGSSNHLDHNKEVDAINLKFAEAREEIEMALESKETVYFNEEAECARAAVNEVLTMFDGLLARLPEKERGALQRSMGLKIEQLKAELKQLDE